MSLSLYLWATFLSGIVSFGGGKTFIPLFEKFYVDDFPIVTSLKLAEIIGLSLALPGAMSPMVAGFVGYEKYGILGFSLGMIILCVPPVILLFALWNLYKKNDKHPRVIRVAKYMQPVILGLMLGVILKSLSNLGYGLYYTYYNVSVFIIGFVLMYKFKMNLLILIAFFGILGIFIL